MQIVFSTNSGFTSWMIRKFSSSVVSHVSLRFGGEESNWMVDSSGKHGGVQPGWWPSFVKKNKVIAIYEITTEKEKEMETLLDRGLHHAIDKEYDYMAILGFAIQIALGKVGWKVSNFLGSRKAMFCSEFILKFSNVLERHVGIKLYEGELEEITPQDLKLQSKVNDLLVLIPFETVPEFKELRDVA